MSSLGSEVPRMMARAARLLPVYAVTGNIGAIDEILPALDRAAEAIGKQDPVAHVSSFHELQAILS